MRNTLAGLIHADGLPPEIIPLLVSDLDDALLPSVSHTGACLTGRLDLTEGLLGDDWFLFAGTTGQQE